jgi:protein-L-isoaspartate(D-aspartate) O-methyltransferase
VCEIGTGTGFNAALLAELAGAGGTVATVETDPVIADSARINLDRGVFAGDHSRR